jgi:hypothetical protein
MSKAKNYIVVNAAGEPVNEAKYSKEDAHKLVEKNAGKNWKVRPAKGGDEEEE